MKGFGIEFLIGLLTFLYPFGAEQMGLPHNFWVGLGCWLFGAAIAIHIFWTCALRFSALEKGLISFIFVAAAALVVYGPLLKAYRALNGGGTQTATASKPPAPKLDLQPAPSVDTTPTAKTPSKPAAPSKGNIQ
jgi:hypothetical protein